MKMNRRNFLKALCAGAVAITVPVSVTGAIEKVAPTNVAILAELFDYSSQLGIMYGMTGSDGREYRHAVRISCVTPMSATNSNNKKYVADVAADALGEWMKTVPALQQIRPPTAVEVLSAIDARFA